MVKMMFTDARIVIVDDEKINILLLEQILRRAGGKQMWQTRSPGLIAAPLGQPLPSSIWTLFSSKSVRCKTS